MEYNWDFQSIALNWNLLGYGLLGTLKVFTTTIFLGFSLGLLVGMGRYSSNKALRIPSSIFVEVFRNTPVLIQIIWFYFAFPILFPIEISPFIAAVLGISLNTAAFSADVFRGGIQSIEPGQWEAARALGMTYSKSMKRIIVPQAIKRMLPPLTGRGIEVFKMSTLASVVAYHETLHQAKVIAQENFNPIETYSTVALIFLVILFPMVQMTYVLEKRFGKSD